MRRAVSRIACCLALCALVAVEARAEGEGRRFRFHPSLKIAVVGDDNIYFTENDRTEDVGVWIRPRIEVGYRRRSLELGADVSADIRRYIDTAEIDQEFLRVHAFGEMGVLPGLTVRLSNSLTPQPVQLGLPEDEAANLLQTNRTTARIEYWRELESGREFEAGVQATRLFGEGYERGDFVNDGAVFADEDFVPDYWEGGAWGEIQSPLGRRNTVWARTHFRYRKFDDDDRATFGEVGAIVGIKTRLFRRVEVSVGGGYGLLLFEENGNRNRILADLDIKQRLARGWSWRLRGQNRFTADLVGNTFMESTGRLTIEKFIGERTAVSTSGFVSRIESENDDGINVFGGIEAKIRRQLTRWMQVSLAYRHWTNGGSLSTDDFRQNRLLLELSLRR